MEKRKHWATMPIGFLQLAVFLFGPWCWLTFLLGWDSRSPSEPDDAGYTNQIVAILAISAVIGVLGWIKRELDPSVTLNERLIGVRAVISLIQVALIHYSTSAFWIFRWADENYGDRADPEAYQAMVVFIFIGVLGILLLELIKWLVTRQRHHPATKGP